MGSVSSVYVSSPERPERDSRIENESNLILEPYHEAGIENMANRNAMEIRVRHSFSVDNKEARESEMGATIQYLAEENGRLAMANRELTRKLKERDKGEVKDIEIYGETAEERLARLEKTLESERMEKWKAIEMNERARVDLVNCERELGKRVEEVEGLKRELQERLGQNVEEKRRRRESEMEAFRADLNAKRELRQAVIAAKSSELQQLRQELEKARASKSEDPPPEVDAIHLENDRLKKDIQAFEKRVRSLNSLVESLRSDNEEEKRKREEAVRERDEMESEKEGKVERVKELEKEKEKMWEDYDKEKAEVNRRTAALKDVIEISRQMLVIRENQVQELKKKLKEIEESVNNSKLTDQKNLKEEYEKQLQNIKTLKELYEERARLMELEKDKLTQTISQHTSTIEEQKGEIESLKEQNATGSEELKNERYQNDSLERDLRLSIAKSKDLENELALINNLFTQMLLGPYNTGNETDLDKLTELLQENHDLITELTLREKSSEIASALPKLLLDLITQVDANVQLEGREPESEPASEKSDSIVEGAVLPILSYKRAVVFEDESKEVEEEEEIGEESKTVVKPMSPAVKEIASNLPKVWRVLMELLSHHTVPDGPPPGDENQCYKNIETPTGTRSVISVSNTFIRLKDLILEKKALQKELARLKQLNTHLETRLDDQEKRLSQVQCELHKTWGIVGRMRAQHQQLHNHERILRYELQEKRVMLSELKQELEYCKDKWERARQKNDESETQWQKLRREFAARKNKNHSPTNLNDSGESGFSDEPNESGEEGENFDADRSSTQSPVETKPCEERVTPEETQPSTSSDVIPQPPPDEEIPRLEEEHPGEQSQPTLAEGDAVATTSEDPNPSPEVTTPPAGASKTDQETKDDSTENADRPGPSRPDGRSVEEILKARSERLKRLEEQCQFLVGKMTNTVQRGTDLSNRLEDIHVEYLNSERGRSEAEAPTGNGEPRDEPPPPQAEGNEKTEGPIASNPLPKTNPDHPDTLNNATEVV